MSEVIDFNKFKRGKQFKDDMARGRTPLYISHRDGKIYGSPHGRQQTDKHFGDRVARIKVSLEKINRLMKSIEGLKAYENRNHT